MRLRSRKIDSVVEQVLDKCRIERPPVNVKAIAQKLGLRVHAHPFNANDGELSGVLMREGRKVILGVNSSHHPNRQRFTIAHEIGHYLLHEGSKVFVDREYRVSFRDSLASQGTDLEEIEANTFAGKLLIPERFLIRDLKDKAIDIESPSGIEEIEKLAGKYSVSSLAMSFRLLNRIQ